MTTSDPIVFVDVDDVLNSHGGATPGTRRHRFAGPHPVTGKYVEGLVYLDPEDGVRLRSLARRAQLVWATSWGAAANSFIAPRLGLEELPHVPVPGFGGVAWGRSLKSDPVFAWADGRPFAWLDDAFGGKDVADAEDRTADGVPTLLVQVDPVSGATADDYTAVERWLDTLEG